MVAPLRPRVAQPHPVFVAQVGHVARMLTWAMHLTLLVPGLLWPREILRDTTFDLPLPALSQLLGRGRRAHFTGEEAWLASVFGIAAPLPAASLRLLGDGGDPAQHEWLCLDPVHWRVGDGAIVLDDPARPCASWWHRCSHIWATSSRRRRAAGSYACGSRRPSRLRHCQRPSADRWTPRCPRATTAVPGESCWPRRSRCCTHIESTASVKPAASPRPTRSGPGAPAACPRPPRQAFERSGATMR